MENDKSQASFQQEHKSKRVPLKECLTYGESRMTIKKAMGKIRIVEHYSSSSGENGPISIP